MPTAPTLTNEKTAALLWRARKRKTLFPGVGTSCTGCTLVHGGSGRARGTGRGRWLFFVVGASCMEGTSDVLTIGNQGLDEIDTRGKRTPPAQKSFIVSAPLIAPTEMRHSQTRQAVTTRMRRKSMKGRPCPFLDGVVSCFPFASASASPAPTPKNLGRADLTLEWAGRESRHRYE